MEALELRVNIMAARLKTCVASAVATVGVAGFSETPCKTYLVCSLLMTFQVSEARSCVIVQSLEVPFCLCSKANPNHCNFVAFFTSTP
jgi:hypothetical protein